ncbi:MAG: DinB family protein [Cyclobacteriaceae bacterium]|nr:DinB family protein [Cyclobacteriaceae bacterium]
MKADRWSSDLDEITRSFRQEFGLLTVDELNWKPNASTWSIAQVVHHLVVVNESYYPILEQIRNNNYYTPRFGQIGFINRFFGKLILSGVQPTQKRKTKTFPIWEPELSAIRSDILKQFEDHQTELKQVICNSEDLIAQGTVISSPANRIIVYKLETAYDIIVAHEKRHFRQAQEINSLRINRS